MLPPRDGSSGPGRGPFEDLQRLRLALDAIAQAQAQ